MLSAKPDDVVETGVDGVADTAGASETCKRTVMTSMIS